MFLWICLFIFLGIIIGVLTGLIPGLHPNTVFVIMVSLLPALPPIPYQYVIVFIVSLAITNTFTDFLPSIIFGAPEPSKVMSVMPSHRMLLEGRGYEAIFLTVMGGLLVSVLTILLLPAIIYLIPAIYESIHSYIHFILIFIAGWMVLTERGISRLYASLMFIFAGLFGFISLNALSSESVLFPALSGLFGLSGMVISLNSKPSYRRR
jgi:putative membrane protein